jgi:hypothetical protein
MIRGVIQVRCQCPARWPAQAAMTPSKSRSNVAVVPHLTAQPFGDVQLVEEQERAGER